MSEDGFELPQSGATNMNMRQRMAARQHGRQIVRDVRRENPGATLDEIKEIANATAADMGLDPEILAAIIDAIAAFVNQLMELLSE